ncbi:DUF4738 domain-containing protein [Tamlana sp. 62-3]|uniref:DUF4738 domain-containing protein n=1 Tax=Neotamlana sargassicola TaxID=2883125 RepID=A0A9X1L4D8_9FLAO|nr:DUF4738 domain-containing protein [Tamlana sargassicola]MCB4807980.1 DUF4738 domain-containing protein [Tamlana sargassicola]
MIKLFLILITTITLYSCSKQKKEKVIFEKQPKYIETPNEQIDSLTIPESKSQKDEIIIERYFPEENETVKFDTIVSALNIKISIKSTTLDSYVTNEFKTDGVKHIDKYRDSEKHLIIKKYNEVVIDTVFKKNDFRELTGQDFLKIANLHGYWFNKIENDTIELFGVISKPETDWSVAFYHFINLKSMTFELREYFDEQSFK